MRLSKKAVTFGLWDGDQRLELVSIEPTARATRWIAAGLAFIRFGASVRLNRLTRMTGSVYGMAPRDRDSKNVSHPLARRQK
jgi:hypothetical protein